MHFLLIAHVLGDGMRLDIPGRAPGEYLLETVFLPEAPRIIQWSKRSLHLYCS
ncbi:MAG: hypothetical protein JXR46_16255 [Calditrichaceae bacterium]|nr:hypothetical protein [Calditrichaceae bacterium]MBN2710598.1 hypothetical protein [Calditrichaceae bacterium]